MRTVNPFDRGTEAERYRLLTSHVALPDCLPSWRRWPFFVLAAGGRSPLATGCADGLRLPPLRRRARRCLAADAGRLLPRPPRVAPRAFPSRRAIDGQRARAARRDRAPR